MKEIKFIFKKNLILNFLIIAIIFIIFTITQISLGQQILEYKNSKQIYNNYKDYQIMQIFDSVEEETNLYKDNKIYENAMNFTEKLAQSKDFIFVSSVIQTQTINGTNLEVIHMNNNTFEFNNLKIKEGENLLNNKNEINILVGSELQKKYPLGSKININYYSEDLVGTISGILEKNSFIYDGKEDLISIDNMLILPEYRNINASEQFKYIASLQYQFGKIFTKDLKNLKKQVQVISNITNYEYYELYNGEPKFLKYLNTTLKINKNTLIINFIIMSITSITILSLLSYFKFQNNKYIYGVYLISGASLKYVNNLIIKENLLIYFWTLIIIFLSKIFYKDIIPRFYFIIIALIIFVIILISTILHKKIIIKEDVLNLIKGDHND